MAYDGSKPANGSNLVSSEIRENFRALKEDGIVVVGDAAVARAQLKTSTGYITSTLGGGDVITITLADYSFFPNFADSSGQKSDPTYKVTLETYYAASNPNSQIGKLLLRAGASSHTLYINYRYITASKGFQGCVLDLPNGNQVFYEFEDAPPDFEKIFTEMADDNNANGLSILHDTEEYDIERKKSLGKFLEKIKTNSGEDYERYMKFYNDEIKRKTSDKFQRGGSINGKNRLG